MDLDGIRLAPGVPSIESLGARGFEDFFGALGAGMFERATLVEGRGGLEVVRYPLPGTPDTDGRRRGAPKGAGTGYVVLQRWQHADWKSAWSARFTHPRSLSLAEREWNLVCHLRRFGVNTGEPLAVGRGGGAVFAQRSFVVLRALDEMRSIDDWSKAELDPVARARIARALGLALARVFESGTFLPRLSARTILATAPRDSAFATGSCGVRDIALLQMGRAPRVAGNRGSLRWGRLPEIAFAGFAGARTRTVLGVHERHAMLGALADSLPGLDRRLLLRTATHALTERRDRARRRAVLASLRSFTLGRGK